MEEEWALGLMRIVLVASGFRFGGSGETPDGRGLRSPAANGD